MKYFHFSAFALLAGLCSFDVYASTSASLQEVLRYALNQDPRVLEAKANTAIAEAQTGISQAGHFPIISLNNTQVLTQKHKDSSSRVESRPSVKGQLNIYSWGGIENSVERDKFKEDYFRYKQDETKEQVGKTIVELYLSALRAKESIKIYNESLVRHQRILQNIRAIAQSDTGRAYEVTEAESRLLETEAMIAQQTRTLQVTLNQLNRYTKRAVTENDLQDPFANENPEKFVARYKNPDLINNPTYLAQQKELESAKSGVKVAKSKLLPALNVEGELYNKGYNVALGMSWNIIDVASYRAIDQNRYTEAAAEAKLQEVLLELEEQAKSSEIDMIQNSRRLAVVVKQIVAQKKAAHSTELQFDIAQRSLLDVLNSYKELSNIEIEEVNIRNDLRVAALNYLVSQAKVGEWAGIK